MRLRIPRHIIPQLDKFPSIVSFCETWLGRVFVIILFAALLELTKGLKFAGPKELIDGSSFIDSLASDTCRLPLGQIPACINWDRHPLLIAAAAAACAFAGRYRPWVLTAATLLALAGREAEADGGLLRLVAEQEGLLDSINMTVLNWGGMLATFIFSAAFIQGKRVLANKLVSRHPIALLLAIFAMLVTIGSSPVVHGMARVYLWSFVIALAPIIWFLAYALHETRAGEPNRLPRQFGAFHPFWGSTSTPFGKGIVYLEKYEAKNKPELAVTQLKGIKLLLWALLSKITLILFILVVHEYFSVPTFTNAMGRQFGGAPYPAYLCWASLITAFVESIVGIVIFGGIFVAGARIAGYRLLRNTYRPLQSRTIAEFWNRYYFYFKELLVDLFFYPAFLGYLRKYRRVRIVFATFMAASVGNMVYHFISEIQVVAELGLWRAVIGFQTYAFYTFALAAGISVSQLWPINPRSSGQVVDTFLRPLKVALFFCILHIFSDTDRRHSLWEHFGFLFHLFGV